jgi:hypothetical protein
MGNQIQNINNLSEDKIIKEERIIKATINSTISLSQSKILINESEFQSISDYSKNFKNNDSTKFYLINKSICKKIEDNNKIIRNPHNDDNKTYIINKHKNINYNNNKNNNNDCNINLENDSKFINFDVINDNSELYDLSKIEDDLILNEKENKDINDEYEYEFEEYITKLNSNNINIDKQLNERPLFSPFILNSDKKYNRKDSKRINNDNNLSKIIKKKINKRNKKKDYFNDLKINQKNKAIKIFETTNSLYVNKNKYYDYQSTNQKSKSKSKNTNEKTVSSNTNITNIEHLNNSSRKKKIILVDFNKINNDNNIYQYNEKINKKNNEHLYKEKIKKNLKLPKISKKRIELNYEKSISPKNNNTIFEKVNEMRSNKKEKNRCLSNNTRKIKRMLTERRNINEIIKINNLTNLILDSNKARIRNLKKNIHTSLSQTFEIKKLNEKLYNSCSFINDNDDKKNKDKISKDFNKLNKISPKEETKRNKKNLKLAYSCSNLFSQYNKLIFSNKNINLSNKRKNKNNINHMNLNYYKISPISQCYKKKKEKENKLYKENKYKTNLNSKEKNKNKYINTSNKTTIFKDKKNKGNILFEINKNKGDRNNINKPKNMKRNNYENIQKKNTKLQNSISYKRFNQINNYKDNNNYDSNYYKKRNIFKIINIDKLLNKDNDDIYKIKNIILSAS